MGEVTIKGHIEIMQVLLFDFVDLLLKLRVFLVLLHNVDVLIKWLRENVLRETHVFLLFNTAIVFIILIRLLNLKITLLNQLLSKSRFVLLLDL